MKSNLLQLAECPETNEHSCFGYLVMPDRLTVLNRIITDLACAESWKRSSFKTDWANCVAEYYIKALSLIELLEVHDCGQMGGFDKGADVTVGRNLVTRTHWLLNKYKQAPQLPKNVLAQWKSLLKTHNKEFKNYTPLKCNAQD